MSCTSNTGFKAHELDWSPMIFGRPLFLVISLAGLLAATACSEDSDFKNRNVILLVIDALRSNRLGCYGYGRGSSPCMDRLAAEGFCFRNALAPSCWTKPSVASLMTGLYPGRHGAVGGVDFLESLSFLDPDHTCLAESMKAAGYATAAFVTNPHIISFYNFDQGFDHFTQPAGMAEELLDKAFQWIEEKGKRKKFFLYLHVFDPHQPYFPPREYRERYAPDPLEPGAVFANKGDSLGIRHWMRQYLNFSRAYSQDRFRLDFRRLVADLKKERPMVRPEEINGLTLDFKGMDDPALVERIDHLTSLYDGEVAYTDGALDRFLRRLEERGMLDDTVFVITADHGEAFFEHGKWGHGHHLHAQEVNVPLIFYTPGIQTPVRGGWNAPVSQVDVFPTILDMLGLAVPEDLDGQSLWRLMRNPDRTALGDRPVFSEHIRHTKDDVAVIYGGRKLIRASTSKGSVKWLFYDTALDPGEKHPLEQDEDDDAMEAMKGLIRQLISGRTMKPKARTDNKTLSEEEMRQLRTLGY